MSNTITLNIEKLVGQIIVVALPVPQDAPAHGSSENLQLSENYLQQIEAALMKCVSNAIASVEKQTQEDEGQ